MCIRERTMNYKHPIAKCPKCKRPIIYSDNPKDRGILSVREIDADYHGIYVLCAKCKTMLAIEEVINTERSCISSTD